MVKSFLNKLESQMPGIKYSIVSQGRDLSDLIQEDIDWEQEDEIQRCERCGEPCSGGVCRKCQLLVDIKKAADESQDHEFEYEEEKNPV